MAAAGQRPGPAGEDDAAGRPTLGRDLGRALLGELDEGVMLGRARLLVPRQPQVGDGAELRKVLPHLVLVWPASAGYSPAPGNLQKPCGMEPR